ncbi:MAG: hypothetical protein ACKVT1_10740 [Dehalococcoidia bacterium]
MAGREDWYRNTTWTPADRDAFELRLKRTRPGNREQYLRIQALVLEETGVPEYLEPALELIDRSIECSVFNHDRSMSLTQRPRILQRLSRDEEALAAWRESMAYMDTLPNQGYAVALDLAEFVIDRRRVDLVAESLEALDWTDPNCVVMPYAVYGMARARAMLHAMAGRMDLARTCALSAIEAATVDRSPFRRHPTVGVSRALSLSDHEELSRLASWQESGSSLPVLRAQD